jgi:hypothetical protein
MDKRTSRFLIVFVSVLVVIGGVLPAGATPESASPRGSRDRRVEKTVPAEGRAVSIETSASDVVIEPVDGNDVRFLLELEYWSKDDKWMEAIEEDFEVDVRETGSEIVFRPSSIPESGRKGLVGRIFGSGEVFYSARIVLEVPRGTEVGVENRYGDVTVGAIGGPLKVNNSSGTVTATGLREFGEIENNYGDVEVTDVEGDLEVVVSSGKISIEEVSGDVEVSSRYGEVIVVGVGGDLTIESSSSKLDVERVGGKADIEGSYEDATVRSIKGFLEIEISSANVSLWDLEAGADVGASYGKVEIENVAEGLEVHSSSGSAEITNVQGPARVENSYGVVALKEIRGSVEISNPSGGVIVESVDGDATIRSSYEAIRVSNVGGTLDVAASSASVDAQQIGGGAEVSTSYAGVILEGVGGAVEVPHRQGADCPTPGGDLLRRRGLCLAGHRGDGLRSGIQLRQYRQRLSRRLTGAGLAQLCRGSGGAGVEQFRRAHHLRTQRERQPQKAVAVLGKPKDDTEAIVVAIPIVVLGDDLETVVGHLLDHVLDRNTVTAAIGHLGELAPVFLRHDVDDRQQTAGPQSPTQVGAHDGRLGEVVVDQTK